MKNRILILFGLLFLLIVSAGCAAPQATLVPTIALPSQSPTPLAPSATPLPTSTNTPAATDTPPPSPTPTPAVLVGAGDVAFCGAEPPYDGDEQTAALIQSVIAENPQATVFIAGDSIYGDANEVEFQKCFEPSWGKFKERIRPAPGNHEYMTDQAAPYFNYFGPAAGDPTLGYYSYELGDWHIVALNSVCNEVSCLPESKQVAWLREDLQRSDKKCTLAYWHHPRFSSGLGGGTGAVSAFWRAAYEMGVDVVVNGHDHNYERFAPMNGGGSVDANGVRLFIVGTGGGVLRDLGNVMPNSEVRYSHTNGILVLKLSPGQYEWQFIPADDAALTDHGTGVCH